MQQVPFELGFACRHRLAKYTPHVAQVCIGKRRPGDRRRIQRESVIGLLILAPADGTDKAVVIEKQTLPAESNRPVVIGTVLEIQLVQVRAFRIRDDRVIGPIRARSLARVKVIDQHMEHVIVLSERGPATPLAGPVVESQSQC